MAKKITNLQDAKKILDKMDPELIKFHKDVFYENKALGGSCKKYENFTEYFAIEILKLEQ